MFSFLISVYIEVSGERRRSPKLHGVDLSEGMCIKARNRDSGEAVWCDLTTFLGEEHI